MNVYIIMYNGNVSSEGYSTEDKAIDHLISQGYQQIQGWTFMTHNSFAYIYEIKVA
ncbi:hypothetical protein [Terrisporobacter sp.]|uniref:hypothetical protein n=1 Tax=Terrisporobacter sp. TaxID=1965305 RepID=UPI00289C169C|nr:hypothetical protein [Terrisporobacter sp.]